jgi:hypothetical protein
MNSLCSSKRQAIINSLLDLVPRQEEKGHQQKVHLDTLVPLSIFRRQVEEDTDFAPVELPYITVSVEINGETQMQTLDRDEIISLVTISNIVARDVETPNVRIIDLNVSEIDSTNVNISDLKIKVL